MATTRQSYSRSVAGHIGGLQGPVCVPNSVQDAAKGRHSGRRAPGPLSSCSGSCRFVLPVRATVKVKVRAPRLFVTCMLGGLALHAAAARLPASPHLLLGNWPPLQGLPHASSSRGAQHSCRQYSYRVLHTGQSLVYCRAARRSSTRDESASDRCVRAHAPASP